MMSHDLLSYEDDATIGGDAELWRRIPPEHVVPDNNQGGRRISSAAFCNHPNGTPMSVVLGQMVLEADRDADSVIAGHNNYCLASITAGLARELQQGITRSPLSEEPAHAEVFGNKSRSVRRRFAKEATWVIGPEA